MVKFIQQLLTRLLPSLCIPPSDAGFELEMFSLKALLLGCLHDIHVCYFFDPLLPQGMEIETLCRTSATVPAVDARGAQVERAPYTTGIVYAPLSHCIRSAQAMLALRTATSQLD